MNVLENDYRVTALLQDGSTLDLNPALLRLSLQEAAEEVAQRAILGLAQTKTSRGWLNGLLPLCTAIQITANGKPAFSGIVWEWEHTSGSSREITLTCYDQFIYAQNSKTFAYFPAGKSTKDIITAICSDNGIPLDYKWTSATHDQTVFRGRNIADQILDTLDDAKNRLGSRPVATYASGKLTIQGEGYNQTIYVFRATESAMSTSERMTMDGLVTQVAIYGAEDDDDRRKLAAVIKGKTEYGILQDTVFLRGSLLGYFIVKGVTHNATDRTMAMELRYA